MLESRPAAESDRRPDFLNRSNSHHRAGRLSGKLRWNQSESHRSADARPEGLRMLELLDLVRDELDQLMELLELCGNLLKQLVEVLKLLLLQRVKLLQLLRHNLQQLSDLLQWLLYRRAESELAADTTGGKRTQLSGSEKRVRGNAPRVL
jgi:hypothetical protein